MIYWQKAATYGRTRIFEVLQYVASQSSAHQPPPVRKYSSSIPSHISHPNKYASGVLFHATFKDLLETFEITSIMLLEQLRKPFEQNDGCISGYILWIDLVLLAIILV